MRMDYIMNVLKHTNIIRDKKELINEKKNIKKKKNIKRKKKELINETQLRFYGDRGHDDRCVYSDKRRIGYVRYQSRALYALYAVWRQNSLRRRIYCARGWQQSQRGGCRIPFGAQKRHCY